MAKVPQCVPTTDLRPRCAMREATVESSGFCEPCHAANIAERYRERERIEYEARTRAWREWDRDRQRRHKLMAKLRPAELASPGVDPLELGKLPASRGPCGSRSGDAPTLDVMSSTKRSTRRWFDRRAGSYESGFTSRWRDPVQRGSLAALDLTSRDRVLDVGCGTGAASRAAAARAASVVGIDLSPQMIQQAVGLADGIENVDFEVADAEQLPFGGQEFTAVLCSNSFHHYPDPLQATREMARVLAPGGRLVIGDACADLATARIADRFLRLLEPGHVRLYRSAELGSFLRGAGLTQVMLRKLANGGFAIVRGVAAA